MRQLAALITIIVMACGGDPASTSQQQPPPPSPITTSPGPAPTPVVTGKFCVGQKGAQVKFDDATPFLVSQAQFPFTFMGEFRGCAETMKAYYDFEPLNGALETNIPVDIQANGDGTWSITFATPPGLGRVHLHTEVTDLDGNTAEALWVLWIKDEEGAS